MPPLPDLSKAEWTVINLCWDQGKPTAPQIYENTMGRKNWRLPDRKNHGCTGLCSRFTFHPKKWAPLLLYEASSSPGKGLKTGKN